MFTIHLEPDGSKPMYEQIYDFIRTEITEHRLPNGSRLPSTRSLAAHLSVSRNTIEQAYTQLVSEGYLDSREKSGYFVGNLPLPAVRSGLSEHSAFSDTAAPLLPLDPPETAGTGFLYDFSPYSINTSGFPFPVWQKLMRQCTADYGGELFLLGSRQGELSLRQTIQNYLYSNRGVTVGAEDIIIGAGADYLLQLLIQLLGSSTVIAMENPSYIQAYRIFHGLGCPVRTVSVDSDGMSFPQFMETKADAVYLTASHQYPLGPAMPVRRRLEFLNWAREQSGRYIIEDDHDSEFKYRGRPVPALKGMDHDGSVVYIGTFSRSIAPAIRIGYMVLPPALSLEYRSRFSHYACTVSRIDQAVLTAFINGGYYERHLRKSLKLYKSRRDAMITALKENFGTACAISPSEAGLHLVVRFSCFSSESALIMEAAKAGIRLVGLKSHYITEPDAAAEPTFLLGFAKHTEAEISSGIKLLYQLCHLN